MGNAPASKTNTDRKMGNAPPSKTNTDFQTFQIPSAIAAAQSICDETNGKLYVIGSFDNKSVFVFDLKQKKYEIETENKETISYTNCHPNFKPCAHSVVPLFDARNANQITEIFSFGGRRSKEHSQHFCAWKKETNAKWIEITEKYSQKIKQSFTALQLPMSVNVDNGLFCIFIVFVFAKMGKM